MYIKTCIKPISEDRYTTGQNGFLEEGLPSLTWIVCFQETYIETSKCPTEHYDITEHKNDTLAEDTGMWISSENIQTFM